MKNINNANTLNFDIHICASTFSKDKKKKKNLSTLFNLGHAEMNLLNPPKTYP